MQFKVSKCTDLVPQNEIFDSSINQFVIILLFTFGYSIKQVVGPAVNNIEHHEFFFFLISFFICLFIYLFFFFFFFFFLVGRGGGGS